MSQLNFTTPVGRLVQGSLYKGNDKDAEGKPLVVKTGPQAGQPRVDFYFALAIPKGAETHWAYTEWGAKIWAKGHEGMASAGQNPKFAWKITDGDSQVPDAKNKRPCDREGFKGHWVLRMSSGFAPRVFRQEGGGFVQMPEVDAVKLGYYVQVNANVDYNGSTQQPGIYINHSMVCFSGYGPEIVVGPDAASAGFGAAPLPAGASAVPLGASAPLPAVGGMPGVPGAPGAPAPAPLIPGLPGAPGAALPGMPPAPGAMVAPAYTMTAKAGGATREAFVAQGWNDAQLLEQGYMVQAVAAIAPPPSVPAPLAPVGSVPMPSHVAPVVVAPNPAILQVPAGVPGVPAVPGMPPAPAAAPAYVMTAAANGATREAFIAQGWNDAQLVQNGFMQLAA